MIKLIPTFLSVLVVEDHADSRLLLCEVLAMLGCEVRAVADAEQALALLNECWFEVLLTDISLPGMSGMVLAAQALRLRPSLRIIFSTAYEPVSCEQIGFPAKILRKPYDMQELSAALVC